MAALSTTSVYAGSFMSVNCNVELSSAVDTPVTVSAVWRRNGFPLTSSANRMLPDAVSVGGSSSRYLAQVVFSPVQLSTDDGVYVCEVTVLPVSETFITGTSATSNDVSLRATGMYVTVFS